MLILEIKIKQNQNNSSPSCWLRLREWQLLEKLVIDYSVHTWKLASKNNHFADLFVIYNEISSQLWNSDIDYFGLKDFLRSNFILKVTSLALLGCNSITAVYLGTEPKFFDQISNYRKRSAYYISICKKIRLIFWAAYFLSGLIFIDDR